MSQFCSVTRVLLCTFVSVSLAPGSAEAGPLLDWLFGRRAAPAYPVGQPIPVGAYSSGYRPNVPANAYAYGQPYSTNYAPYGRVNASYGNYYSSRLPVIGAGGAGYSVGPQSGIVAAAQPSTIQPGTMSYVPNYRSSAYRAPVTYYRPLLTTDPNTGAHVVAMAPCTSYEYQLQRSPALGRSALYGALGPTVAPRQTIQTYTLPNGGVPLASSAPAYSAPTVRSYGSYSALQPSAGNYSTVPAGQQPYYGTTNGGSCGNYSAPVPGLSAPPAPTGVYPSSPSYPSTSPGTMPQGTIPDAADRQPTLPGSPTAAKTEYRPKLRSIYQTPPTRESTTASQNATVPQELEAPAMRPIPAPDDFDGNRPWNPGLLREEDLTARRATPPPTVQYAGQSKAIHWASFEQGVAPKSSRLELNSPQRGSYVRPVQQNPQVVERDRHLEYQANRPKMIPVESPSLSLQSSRDSSQNPVADVPASRPANRRSTGGWQVSR